MIVVSACRSYLAALLIGVAAASNARTEEFAEFSGSGQEATNPAPEVTKKAAHTQHLKRKLKVEWRAQRSSTSKAPAGKPRQPAEWGNTIPTLSDGSIPSFNAGWALTPADGFSRATAHRKLTAPQPTETARTNIDWEQPNGEVWSRGQWSQRGTIQTNVVAPDAKLEIFGTKLDVARAPNSELSELSFIQPKSRERNQVDDLKLKLSTSNEILQLTIRESESSYSADTNYLLDLARKNRNDPGVQRFLQSPGTGHADLQRLDFKLYDTDSFGVTAFAFRKDVDLSYMSFTAAKAKDEFAAVDQTGATGGAKVRLGAISLTSSYGNYERASASNDVTRARQDHTVALDTAYLASNLRAMAPAFLDALIPSSISVTRFDSQTPSKTPTEGLVERTTGYAGNAAWKWDSGYANVSYWNYRLDGEASGASSYAFAGRGVDAGFGVYRDALGVYSGISYYQADDLSPLSHSATGGFDAYALLTYKLNDFPDLSFSGNLGRYDYASFAFPGTSSGAHYWSATVGFDFSKWLRPDSAAAQTVATSAEGQGSPGAGTSRFNLKSPVGDKPSVKLFYRYATEPADETTGGQATDSHLFAAALRGRF
jgi:hypothetical protein